MFTWIPIYKEIAEKVLEYENQQANLIKIIRDLKDKELPVVPIDDKDVDEKITLLEEIDPFTFFACFNRKITDEKRIEIIRYLKNLWKLTADLPGDFAGIPRLDPRNSWFFDHKKNRNKHDIPLLWTLFKELLSGEIKETTFNNVLNIRFVNKKITLGLFWIRPQQYINIDGINKDFLKKYDINPDFMDYKSYAEIMEQAKKRIGKEFYEISHEAYLHKNDGSKEKPKSDSNNSANTEDDDQKANNEKLENLPLNLILYGPPGTGKTYNSIDVAVEIADGTKQKEHKINKQRFDELRKKGRIQFVTFHQNYSYEDFMLGIRPNVEEYPDTLSFTQHYGIFYNMVKEARKNYEESKKEDDEYKTEKSLEEKLEEFKEYVRGQIEEEGEFEISEKRVVAYIFELTKRAFRYNTHHKGAPGKKNLETDRSINYDQLLLMYRKNVKSKQEAKQVEGLLSSTIDLHTYSLAILKKFKDFLEEHKPSDTQTTFQKPKLQNYVLIIDEINRANISRVFGEFITLLEDDKRLGADNELTVTLPNGEEKFGMPPNLYIIGTMNTADKSIALIDIALRRRFEFVGYYPDYDLIKNEKAKNLLTEINTAIYEKKKSSDYCIGHSYFMNITQEKDIEAALRKKVIPLLMEYLSGNSAMVSDIFKNTDWTVKYKPENFAWDIKPRASDSNSNTPQE